MKKWIALVLAAVMLLALAACGGTAGTEAPAQSETASETAPAETAAPAAEAQPEQTAEAAAPAAQEIAPAENGVLKLASANLAIVVKGKAVPMPYRFAELKAAGVPVDDAIGATSLGAGDIFSPNLFLDENQNYVIIPAYNNTTENATTIADASAKEITMTTYDSEPKDQDVSILGVKFGMKKSEVKTLLGAPAYEEGEAQQWTVELTDASQTGNCSVIYTSAAEDAVVSQVVLSVIDN